MHGSFYIVKHKISILYPMNCLRSKE
uniref:Uncharacterized protein n=1 Tax=Rhizophora mucronata TaxID=61149 RepID=A0A2P2QQE4_RHIMU